MGLFACLPCLEKHELKPDGVNAGFGICEVCQKSSVWRNFTWDLTRFAEPIEEQLERHRKEIKIRKGCRGNRKERKERKEGGHDRTQIAPDRPR